MKRTGPLILLTAAILLVCGSPADAAPTIVAAGEVDSGSTWAGYVSIGNFHNVTAKWTVPAVTCVYRGSVHRVDTWVGLNGAPTGDGRLATPLMQTGADNLCTSRAGVMAEQPGRGLDALVGSVADNAALFGTVLGLQSRINDVMSQLAETNCAIGALDADTCRPQLFRYAWNEDYPNPVMGYIGVTPNPGDTMQASVTYDGARYTMTLADLTQRWTRTTVRPSQGPALTADVVVEGVVHNPMPRHSPVTFTNITVDGKPLAVAPNLLRYTLQSGSGDVIPGPVQGSQFTVP